MTRLQKDFGISTVRVLLPALLASMLFAIPLAAAGSAMPVWSGAPVLAPLIRQKRFADVEKILERLQHAYETDPNRAESLREAFESFATSDSSLELVLDEWVEKYPRSYAAYLARGIYYTHLGWKARGDGYINETAPAQIENMGRLFHKKALPDLRKSLTLTKKPLITYYYLITIGSAFGWEFQNRQWLAAANMIDPANVLAKRVFLLSLRPQWGGSMEEMIAFVKDSDRYPLSRQDKNQLESDIWRARARQSKLDNNYHMAALNYSRAIGLYDRSAGLFFNRGNVYDHLGEYHKAVDDYTRALSLSPPYMLAYSYRGVALRNLGQYDKALADLTRALELNPDDDMSWANRGFIYDAEKQCVQAVSDYQRAAKLGDAWAQDMLGIHYWKGEGVTKDSEQAFRWWRIAAHNGSADATHNLEVNGQKP